MLRQIDLIAAQNEETASRFLALGADTQSVRVTGSLKYDGAETDRQNPRTQTLRELARIAANDIVFLAGSTQEPEEQIALDIFRRLAAQHPRLRLVLVPRHPERFSEVAKLLEASALPWQRRTELTNQPPAPPGVNARVLLVDTVGELGAWWGTAHIAFVGGSFGTRGGQNMLEPAAYGAAVSFGPNTRNFRDIVASLKSAGAAVVVNDALELEAFVRRCLEDPAYAAEVGGRAQNLVLSQLGATVRTVAYVDSLLPKITANAASREAA
jgi:3-deoxy-D-manno-octulosonic-acid transferase